MGLDFIQIWIQEFAEGTFFIARTNLDMLCYIVTGFMSVDYKPSDVPDWSWTFPPNPIGYLMYDNRLLLKNYKGMKKGGKMYNFNEW